MGRRDLPWLLGLLAFPVAGLLFLALTGASAVAAAVVGAIAALVVFAVVRVGFPASAEDDGYSADARRRVEKVLSTVQSIERMSMKVTDPQARRALQNGCQRIPELLDSVREHDETGVASMAAKLNVTTSGVQRTLAQYLDIQKDPDLYTDSGSLLAAGLQGFVGFDRFVVDTFRRLNDVEVIDYKATLAALQPLEIHELTQGGTT
jgi:hypothetical protein